LTVEQAAKFELVRALREQIIVLHRRLLAIVRGDEVCRRLMTTPGVATFKASMSSGSAPRRESTPR
jgi:transposase